ncbi:MAG: phosphoribosylanthranilate isomerase [Leptolyngbyaceae bacterium]|nr:phosphoribosylanthranilate isomerase [Leptolyngbyaceae bacterium]
MRIKICGITQPDQGVAIARLGATALGFICVPTSPRYVTPAQIQAITQPLLDPHFRSSPVDRIGVFVNESLEKITQTVAQGQLNGVQLHGDESIEFCQQVKATLPQIELIKAFRIRNATALVSVYAYAAIADALLLDAYHPTLLGGTGHTLDWSLLQSFQPGCPWFLAGGLNPDNVGDAIAQVHPDGIDLSSGVERSPGQKDLAQVKHLFDALAISS